MQAKAKIKVLVVGDRARDHAIALKLSQSGLVEIVYVTPGNIGTGIFAINLFIPVDDLDEIARKAGELGIEYAVIGPEEPLRDGIVGKLEAKGIKVLGPTSDAAEIEWSKIYAALLNKELGLPQPRFWWFDDMEDALAFVLANPKLELVVKADLLAGGKAVTVCRDQAEAFQVIASYMNGEAFGEAGRRILIQERVRGVEVSALGFCSYKDGEVQLSEIFLACDTKQRDGHEGGRNTGGIACFGQPMAGPAFRRQVREIMLSLLRKLLELGRPFVGVLYAGLMVTEDGEVKVLEWNSRLGDPEGEALAALLKGDLGEIMLACIEGRLDQVLVEYDTERVCVCLVLLDKYYPDNPKNNGFPITGLNEGDDENVFVLHFQTQSRDGETVTEGSGRRLLVGAIAITFEEALELAQERIKTISFLDMDYLHNLQERFLPEWARYN
jgi:phosphoribosylamine---glycine ligase